MTVMAENQQQKDQQAIEESYNLKQRMGEPPLLDVAVEQKGVQDILAALTQDETLRLADDNMPLRHFRAEKGNTQEAIRKIKETLVWRQEFGVDKIKSCFNNEHDFDDEFRSILTLENATGKLYVRGYDCEGRACIYMRPAKENTHNELDNMRHVVYNLERAIACTLKKSGKEKINIMIDYTGFRVRDAPPMSASKHFLTIVQNHYPERLHCAYVCHPPTVFRVFWTLIKPFIDPVTKQKIVFCSDKAGRVKLEERFDISTVEVSVFGTGTDLREFNSKEYLSSPLDTTFDEMN